jgi:hypothetical protein
LVRALSRLSWLLPNLFLAVTLISSPASAATFSVPCGDVAALTLAINDANATTAADTIVIANGPCTFTLTSPAALAANNNNTGLPIITRPLTILGNGATIQRASSAAQDFRLLLVNGPAAHLDVRDLSIVGGRLSGGNVGAGVVLFAGATANFENVAILSNQVSGTSPTGASAAGAGLWAQGGTFTFDRGVISFNQAPVAAAFSMTGTQGVIRRSVISGNGASSSTGAGWLQGGSLVLENVTVAGNHAANGIGGIVISNSGAAAGTAKVSFSTFLDNGRTGSTAPGTALFRFLPNGAGQATIELANSIVADTDSTAAFTSAPCTGVTPTGANIEWPTNTCEATVVNPMLAAPVSSLSAAWAWRPRPGSNAIDAGGSVCPATDQRLAARPDGEACDIGAYETPAPETVASGPSEPTMDPEITFSSPDTPNATFQCKVDSGAFAPCTSPFAPAVSLGTHTVAVRAISPDGYADASPASVTFVMQDTIEPVVACSAPATTGWKTGDVTVACTATDAGTGLQDPADASFRLTTSGDGAAVSTGTRTISDAAGNVTTAGPYGPYMVDKGLPVVTCQAPSAVSASKTDIVVRCTASDDVSGLADAADATFTLTTSGEGTVVDVAGTLATVGPFGPYQVDKTAPVVVAPPAVDVTATSASGAVVTDAALGSASASDATSPVTVTRGNVPAGNLFPVGTTVVTYTAVDAAGNSATATQSVTVTPASLVLLLVTQFAAVLDTTSLSSRGDTAGSVVADATAAGQDDRGVEQGVGRDQPVARQTPHHRGAGGAAPRDRRRPPGAAARFSRLMWKGVRVRR